QPQEFRPLQRDIIHCQRSSNCLTKIMEGDGPTGAFEGFLVMETLLHPTLQLKIVTYFRPAKANNVKPLLEKHFKKLEYLEERGNQQQFLKHFGPSTPPKVLAY
ncbi:hypothetical protein VP01_5493g1, partial [Puccinia sorghi]